MKLHVIKKMLMQMFFVLFEAEVQFYSKITSYFGRRNWSVFFLIFFFVLVYPVCSKLWLCDYC